MSGATPIYGLRYPDFSDNVADGADDIQALATDMESTFSRYLGMVKLIPSPTGHIGVTFDSRGTGTVATSITQFGVNNVFSSAYSSYRIVISTLRLSNNSNCSFQFRDSSGNAIPASYYASGVVATSGLSTANTNNSNAIFNFIWGSSGSSTPCPASVIDVYNPFSTGIKGVNNITIANPNEARLFMGSNASATQAAGFSIFLDGQVTTNVARVCIYAWND